MRKVPSFAAAITVVLCVLGLAQTLAAAGRNAIIASRPFSGDTIVFTPKAISDGDAKGGTARRLTSHTASKRIRPSRRTARPWPSRPSMRARPRSIPCLSPAGCRSAARSPARRRRWSVGPPTARSSTHQKYSTLPNTQLVVSTRRRTPRRSCPESGADGTFDPAGRTLYFTRLPFQAATRKRYKGGTAQNLWAFASGAPEAVPLTADYAGTSKNPMVCRTASIS